MKRKNALWICGLLLTLFFVPESADAQDQEGQIFRQEGIASWYGAEFDGRPTASGEIFNSSLFTAAHPTLPFGTVLIITNTQNSKKVTVRVNDRGPFVSARIIDVSRAAAEQLDILTTGTAPVLVESTGVVVFPSGTGPDSGLAGPPASGKDPAPASGSGPGLIDPGWTPAAPAEQPPLAAEAGTGRTPPPPQQPPSQQPPPRALPPIPEPRTGGTGAAAVLKPAVPPRADKTYRLQVGSYRVARNAVEAFERLKNAGLNPAYERNGEFFRVVLAGIRGADVQLIAEKLGSAGFQEALIREEP
jgi:rare lipoprotein A